MAIKFITVFVLIAAASAIPIELDSQQDYQRYQTGPEVKKVIVPTTYAQQEEYDNAEYKFNYAVNDDHTGDVKTQEETRKGDRVEGRYTLLDSDGYQRIVEYTADDHNGFQAVVHREPIQGYKAQVVPVQQAAKVSVPLATKTITVNNYENQPSYTNDDIAEYNYQH